MKFSNACRTASNEALSVLTGMMPIDIEIEKTAQLYQITKDIPDVKTQFDKDKEVKILVIHGRSEHRKYG